jgi:hypothetical protein
MKKKVVERESSPVVPREPGPVQVVKKKPKVAPAPTPVTPRPVAAAEAVSAAAAEKAVAVATPVSSAAAVDEIAPMPLSSPEGSDGDFAPVKKRPKASPVVPPPPREDEGKPDQRDALSPPRKNLRKEEGESEAVAVEPIVELGGEAVPEEPEGPLLNLPQLKRSKVASSRSSDE